MPDGEMRRPPQLWEQRLTRLTSVLSVGMSSSGATSIVEPTPAPGADSGVEPAPVLPPPDDFVAPSQPTLIGSVQGINVVWDGLNSVGDLWPYDTSYVEVHMSTSGPTFTPGSATLKGRLDRPGAFYVGGLTAGSTYYFRLRGADPAGNVTDPSDAASGLTGLTTAGDYGTATIGSGAVSFDARTIGGVTNTVGSVEPSNPIQGDVWLDSSPGTAIIHKIYNGSSWVTNAWGSASIAAGQISALQIAAGAVTAGAIAAGAVTTDKLTAGTISGFYISGGTIAGGYISGGTISGGYITGGTLNAGYINGGTVNSALVSGGTITGSRFSTSSGTSKISIVDNSSTPAGTVDAIEFYQSSSVKAYMASVSNGVSFYADYVYFANKANTAYSNVTTGDLTSTGDLDVAASVDLGYSGVNRAFRVNASGDVLSLGIQAATTGDAANVRVATGTGGQLLRSTSSARYKDQLAPLSTDLSGVDADKLADFGASVDPYDVLALTPTEFRSLAAADDEARLLGFIAEDVAAKFPWAAEWNEAGQPDAVKDRPILAALLSVVQDQQATITALTARIEALEA